MMVLKCKNIKHEKQKRDISYLTDLYGEEEEGIYENRQQAWKGKEYSPSPNFLRVGLHDFG